MAQLSETTESRVTLQSIAAGDEEFLFQVYASTRVEELAACEWSEPQRENFLRMQFQAQDKHYRENYPGATLQIINVDGECAGRLYVHRRKNEIRVMDIALLPIYRRRGIGTALMDRILFEGAKTDKSVTIHVEIFNPALCWYERLGFKKIAVNGPYYLMERTVVKDACLDEVQS
ncbi:MAG: GNAT family N-acetyltransferase [Verrucomicrobiota bacterium]|nr:GNAT family N-acetyltransferase [Verrucomicrobiota bacterium]